MAALAWHLLANETDYLGARPVLVAHKPQALELQAGRPSGKGNSAASLSCNVRPLRDQKIRSATQSAT